MTKKKYVVRLTLSLMVPSERGRMDEGDCWLGYVRVCSVKCRNQRGRRG